MAMPILKTPAHHDLNRRTFLGALGAALWPRVASPADEWTYAVTGRVRTASLGVTLPHEHVMVDFGGAAIASRSRYDADEVFRLVLPHLERLKSAGCRTLVECTPAFLGRDPQLLVRLSRASDVTLLTNTGYYGAGQDKYVPAHAFDEPAESLASRWTREFEEGIEGTAVRPGFIKTGVDKGPLSEIDRKLVKAAALCHRRTGLVICCHSGNAEAAMGALDVVRAEGVSPEAFVWVHAQNEPDPAVLVRVARAGAWVSVDGIRPSSLAENLTRVRALIEGGATDRVMLSQDAGWYRVGEEGGGEFAPFTPLFEEFLPALRRAVTREDEVQAMVERNPARAFAVRRRLAGGVRRQG
jgi:phosphotriesterase-related protein